MTCVCSKLPDFFFLEEGPKGFESSLEQKDTSVPNWKNLCRCRSCGALWAIDEWDKYHDQVASRVRDVSHWDEDSEEERKKLLLKSRGGLSDEPCAWLGCEKRSVRGVAYCLNHLYATGARK